LKEAVDSDRRVERPRVAVDIDDRQQLINLVIEPFREDDSEPLLLVVFKDVGAPMTPAEGLGPESAVTRWSSVSSMSLPILANGCRSPSRNTRPRWRS
jgi:hypothetical protein